MSYVTVAPCSDGSIEIECRLNNRDLIFDIHPFNSEEMECTVSVAMCDETGNWSNGILLKNVPNRQVVDYVSDFLLK